MEQEILRKLQLTQLEIAKEIKRVAEELGLRCFLVYGTLLGAVRHQGFIPWDDDLDVGMLREEYDAFLQKAPGLLGDAYELVTYRSEKMYPFPFAKVMKKGTVYMEERNQASFRQGIFVDVFPFDRYPADSERKASQSDELRKIRALLRAKCRYKTWKEDGKTDWKRYLKNLPVRALSVFKNKDNLVEQYEEITKRYNTEDGGDFFPPDMVRIGREYIPKEGVQSFTELPFEDTKFLCPAGYDAYLKVLYGDYMTLPPVEKRANRHQVLKLEFGEK